MAIFKVIGTTPYVMTKRVGPEIERVRQPMIGIVPFSLIHVQAKCDLTCDFFYYTRKMNNERLIRTRYNRKDTWQIYINNLNKAVKYLLFINGE